MTTRLSYRRWQQGVGIIELLVALVLSAILIAGAATIYAQSRNTFRSSEEVARLQETARYAMSFLETDLRMANYWGLSNRADYITNRAGQPDAPSDAWVNDLCGANWPINLDRFVEAYDASKGDLSCIDAIAADSDVLVVRRVAEAAEESTLLGNTLYVQSSRLQGTMFVADGSCADPGDAGCIPAGYLPPLSRSAAVMVHGYYIANNAAGIPSLRRVRLTTGPDVTDEEIIPGVEDFQVELGVDNDGDTTADYFAAADIVPTNASVVAVRIWVRVRSATPDFRFLDDRTYTYSNNDGFTPDATGDANRFRRMLVSKTIQLRNTRT